MGCMLTLFDDLETLEGFPVCQCRLQSDLLSIAPDDDFYCTARGRQADHVDQMVLIFHRYLIEDEHNVIGPDSCGIGGSSRVNAGDQCTTINVQTKPFRLFMTELVWKLHT